MLLSIVHSANRSDQYTVVAPDILRDSGNGRVALRGKGQTTIIGKTQTTIKVFSIEVYLTEEEICKAHEHVIRMREDRTRAGIESGGGL